MAKPTKRQQLPVRTDRTYFYTDLAYMPSDIKERKMWGAQSLFFAKLNSAPLVDPTLAAKYRTLNLSIIDEGTYRAIIDPVTKMNDGQGGGSAEYTSADFKAWPGDVHLDNIIEAKIEKIPINLSCTVNDPIAKLQEQKDKEKIIQQTYVRGIVNNFIKELGGNTRPISENEDPYKWIEKFTNTDLQKVVDTVGSPIDQIKNRIKDDKGLRLFMKFVYKNGIEIAFEQAIKFYLIEQNEWSKKSQYFLRDLKNFNTIAATMYTNLTTGRKELRYEDPANIFTSPYNQIDGKDQQYWYKEEPVTFAEFEQMVGAELTNEDKKDIFNYFKTYATNHGVNWDENITTVTGRRLIGGSKIMLGRYSVLTQEANEFSEYYMNNQDTDQPTDDLGWSDTEKNKTKEQNNKVYNVWYSFYYLPLNPVQQGVGGNGGSYNTQANWDWQANHIYHIEKNVDMYRFGVDERYAKSDLITWRDLTRPSFTDIKERFMPKIHTAWHKFQNCIVNDVQAMISDMDLITGLLNAVDEGNAQSVAKNQNAVITEMRKLKQSGAAWLKFRDKNGQKLEIDPRNLFVTYDNGMLEKAQTYLLTILSLYDQMTRALAINDVSEGLQPKPRTPLGGIEQASQAADNNIWYIEKAYTWVLIMCAERIVQHVKCICKEKKNFHYEERWKELIDVVGFASGATLEGIEKIPLANVGLSVSNQDTSAVKSLVNQMATQMVTRSQITPAQLELLLDTPNWKLALYELSVELEEQEEKAAQARQQEFRQQMALEQQRTQTAMALQNNKAQGVNSNIQTQGVIDSQINTQMNAEKAQTMAQQKEQLKQNKIEQDVIKSQLKQQELREEANIERQAALV